MPTRLLDWTLNPLVALYFAVEPDEDCDSAVYALLTDNWLDDRHRGMDPFEIDKVYAMAAPHVSPRVHAQSGHFTVQPDPTEALIAEQLTKIVIAASARNELLYTLHSYGVSSRSLYPDLDGLSRWLRRMHFGYGIWSAADAPP